MHKKPIDLRRLTALLVLTLLLAFPSGVAAAGLFAPGDPEQTAIPDTPTDLLSAGFTPPAGYAYTVQPGDDVWLIAVAHGLDMDVLIETNELEAPYWIHPGQKLWVPAEPAPVRRAAPAPAVAAQEAPEPAAEPASPSTPPVQGRPAGDWATIILDKINQKRAQYGLATLSWSDELARAARAHAEDCARRGWGSHTGSDGARLRTRLARAGYAANWVGENWVNVGDPHTAFAWWWNEPPGADPHRQNILGVGFSEVGVGIVQGGYGYYFVADFGSR